MIEEYGLDRRPTHIGLWCVLEFYATDDDGQFIADLPMGDPENILGKALSIGLAELRKKEH